MTRIKRESRFNNDKLRELRKERGMSQANFALAIDVNWRTIYLWERGEVVPGYDLAVAIADFFDVSLDEFRR